MAPTPRSATGSAEPADAAVPVGTAAPPVAADLAAPGTSAGDGRAASRRPGGIDLRGFGWRHAGRRAWAVRGVDLRVEPGERVLLLGPSGAGKSTLLAAVAGLLAADSGEQEGELRVDGRPGIVFQDPQTQLVMARSGDDVAFGLENLGVPAADIWPRVDEALGTVGFRYGRDRPTTALSGGEQQRLALAGALALRPGVLLLDEPTANLDPAGAATVRAAIRRSVARGGHTLLLIEHRLAEVLADGLVDRVVVLEPGGGISADGHPDAVFAAHGATLAAAGVWVPGHPLPTRPAVAAPGPPLLVAQELGFRHPGADRAALAGLDLVVRAGEALTVRGPNGSGKSTLALLLGGLIPPTTGRLIAQPALTGARTVAGTAPTGDLAGAGRNAPLGDLTGAGRNAPLGDSTGGGGAPAADGSSAGARDRRRLAWPWSGQAAAAASPAPYRWPARLLAGRIGSVFQNPEHQFVTGRVDEELALGPRRAGAAPERVRAVVGDLLERLRLAKLAAANPFTLSGGEQRRLSVATALATSPRLLVLDEPTFGQDRRTWIELVELLAALRDEGTGLVAVTHDADFAAALGDRTVSLGGAGRLEVAGALR